MKRYIFCLLLGIFAVSGGLYKLAQAQNDGGPKPLWCAPQAAPGDTKDKIKNEWGDPDVITDLGTDETGLKKEEWVYYSKPFSFFSKNSYVCVTQRLVFIGDNLVKVSSSEEKIQKEYGPEQ